ncbi:hypothetical protein [Nocardioides ungokensis]|uniref:hypothetical protein n=1 Tax=Nocardioides ungokensis TaxID=1643322 RepID=UPI001C6099B3|nr:hypothetical protein [Nocardioides ungokensis]
MAGDAGNWWKVAAFAAGACVISAIAVLTGPSNTHRVPTREVGLGTARRVETRPVTVGVAS